MAKGFSLEGWPLGGWNLSMHASRRSRLPSGGQCAPSVCGTFTWRDKDIMNRSFLLCFRFPSLKGRLRVDLHNTACEYMHLCTIRVLSYVYIYTIRVLGRPGPRIVPARCVCVSITHSLTHSLTLGARALRAPSVSPDAHGSSSDGPNATHRPEVAITCERVH